MRFVVLIFAIIFLSSCANQISADKLDSNPNRPTSPIINDNSINSNKFQRVENETDKIDKKRRDELETQNEKFLEIPKEFRDVDFENFKFPMAKLVNGEFEDIDEEHLGGTTYYLGPTFFVNLVGDEKKEAIVFLFAVSCGVSCDGGNNIILFYESLKGKPKLLDFLESGNNSGGCNLKSFTTKNKKIHITQFGNCKNDFKYEENRKYSCKFCVKDLTNSIYTLNNKNELVREFVEEIKTPETNIINYPAEIDINE